MISQSQQQSLFTSNKEEADTTLLRKQQASFRKSIRYRYINFNGVRSCHNFSIIWLVLGHSRKKNKQGGVEDTEFPWGIEEIASGISRG